MNPREKLDTVIKYYEEKIADRESKLLSLQEQIKRIGPSGGALAISVSMNRCSALRLELQDFTIKLTHLKVQRIELHLGITS